MTSRILPIVGTSLLVLAACGGGSSEPFADDSDAVDDALTDSDSDSDSTSDFETDAGLDLPFSSSGFDQTCATQVAFTDTTAYDPSATTARPVVVLEAADAGGFIKNFSELPSGWVLEDDDDFEDNSELGVVQLAACLSSSEQTASGVMCELGLDDGSVATLEVVEVTYDVNIYATQTGELVGTESIAASGTDCPGFAYIDDGQTQYFNSADADQIATALASYVAPGGIAVDPTELPANNREFNRLCTTPVGFGGATPLTDGAGGPRPVELFQESDSGLFVTSTIDAPAGWVVDDASLQAVELVACSSIGTLVDNGVTCSLESDDGTVTTLTLLNGTYDLVVYEAVTGAVVASTTLEANSTDCPLIALVDEGQTELLATPEPEAYIEALQSVVEPG
ncbi:MAG: hypothetical protein AB8G14_16795 [Ilumatobacter sp.]